MKKMRLMVMMLLLTTAMTCLAGATQKKDFREISRLYQRGELEKALKLTEKALNVKKNQKNKNTTPAINLVQMKYNILMRMKKYDDALAFIDEQIKTSGESEQLLSAKYNILLRKKYLHSALKTIMRKYEISKNKSPWDCITIMHTYMQMGSRNDALDWLDEAVRRGFHSYRILESEKYQLLHKDKRFYDIIENVKVSIGLGSPARDFSMPLMSGETFKLSEQRGKVVLVCFWATWCKPCRADFGYLKEYYHQLKNKGFEVVGISLDSDDKPFKAFLEKTTPGWKQGFSGKGWDDPVAKSWRINNIPSYWLIDKKGFLRAVDLSKEKLFQSLLMLLSEK